MPFTVREGINIFLAGFVPTENMRFRDEELNFKISDTFEDMKMDKSGAYKYPQVNIHLLSYTKRSATSNLPSCQAPSGLLILQSSWEKMEQGSPHSSKCLLRLARKIVRRKRMRRRIRMRYG